jgi:hypothetical protein
MEEVMDISDLLNNNSILQYMSGVGAAMSEGKSPATAMNQITQQQLGAQSKVKMQNNYIGQLKDIIGGGDAAKTTAKKPNNITITPDGIKHTIPWDAVNNPSTDTVGLMKQITDAGISPESAAGITPIGSGPIAEAPITPSTPVVSTPLKSPVGGATVNGQAMTQAERQAAMAALSGDPTLNAGTYGVLAKDMLNPSTRPLSINGADLAGLSSADVSQALHDTLGVETARQTSLKNAGELLYQGAEAYAKTNPKADPESLPYPIPVPGLGQVSARQWKELPTNQKEYAAYAYTQKQTNSPTVSYEDFQNFGKEHQSQYLEKLMQRPDLMATALALKKAGATSVNLGPLENAIQGGKGRSVAEVLAPDYLDKIKKGFARSMDYIAPDEKTIKDIQAKHNVDPEKATAINQYKMEVTRMDADIKQAYRAIGKDAIRKQDGWYVDGTKVRDML